MKNFFITIMVPLVLFSLAGLNSCEINNNENSSKGTIEFTVSLPSEAVKKSVVAIDSNNLSLQLLVTVTDLAGNPILTDKMIPLYSFGTEFVSENIEIKPGEYKLTKFMVIDTAGEVVYAAPVEGSPLAYLCNKPLPLGFRIVADLVTRIVPQVLAVGVQTPDKFGYASFGMHIITPLEFYTVCILDNPLIMAPVQFTTATLTVYAQNGWHYTFKLEPSVNKVVIQGGSEIYTLVVEKEGFPSQKIQVPAKELIACTKENPYVLRIPLSTATRTIILQPDPEKGKDAMISNLESDKNFGDYKYFEATFLSEPILTVMRSNRSLIAFNLDTIPKSAIIKSVILRLSYDLPIPFDNSYLKDSLPVAGTVWYGGVLQQIIEPWEEGKVTWNTQPKTIETGQVFVPPFIRNANFIDVDITRLIVPVTASALPNYGMLFRLWPVDQFPGFRFASSDYAEPKMRPQLIITYTLYV
jgi:hypothetical protein